MPLTINSFKHFDDGKWHNSINLRIYRLQKVWQQAQ